jgi:hypothetical protein
MHSWQNYLVLHSSRYFTQARDEGAAKSTPRVIP